MKSSTINSNYEDFYKSRGHERVYPTEFVVRVFLASYPALSFVKPHRGQKVLDIGFGDGRNTLFLCDQGLQVSGTEITEGIVRQAAERLDKYGHHPDLRVGRNSELPFIDDYFDYVLACHCCYYLDENELFSDNLREYSRTMKVGSYLIASVASSDSYIFIDSEKMEDGSMKVCRDPYGNRVGSRLQAFSGTAEIQSYMSQRFEDFSFGSAINNFFGIDERVY